MKKTKRCSKCKQVKALDKFGRDSRAKDKLRCQCKECDAEYARSEAGKNAWRRYRQSEKGKETLRCYGQSKAGKEVQRRFRQTEANRAIQRRYKKSHLKEIKARECVNEAVRIGKLSHISTQLCVVCSNPAVVYHHHLGYAPEHWLDVVPLCQKCHTKAHS